MNPKFLPVFLLALTGCRETTVSVAAPNEAPTPIELKTPLDTYLARPETAYKWTEISDGEFADGDFNLRLTSQFWQGQVWTHRLQIFKPDTVRHPDAAILNISYGGGSLPETFIGKSLANATGAYVVHVFNVPNQPLFDKTEDELVAYTFAKYLETGDSSWPLLFPMTKAVTKTMDALQEWSKSGGRAPLSRFIVMGASKRGWTAYLAAAGDKRVIGAVPIVYDNLNLTAQIAHQKEIWGETSPLAAPYAKAGLMDQTEAQNGKKLSEMIDPWAYRARLTLPKLIINATNDGYWAHDSLNLYRQDLEGRTDVFYVPNAPHTLGADIPAAIGTVAAWSRLLLDGKAAPKVELKVENSPQGRVFSVAPQGAPRTVKLWIASSPSKDFRRATWKTIALPLRDGSYRTTVTDEVLFAGGAFAAAFAEIEIAAQPLPLRLSSLMWQGEK